ncbi:hypothetical protein YB2330_000283 [Saitoella coloradoensis]
MSLPPAPEILDSNPKFEALYKRLWERLDPVSGVVDYGEDARLDEELENATKEWARHALLLQYLKLLSMEDGIPTDLRQYLDLIIGFSELRQATSPDLKVPEPDSSSIMSGKPSVSKRINQDYALLVRTLFPDPSTSPRNPTLLDTFSSLLARSSHLQFETTSLHLEAIAQTERCIDLTSWISTTLIRNTDDIRHGSADRAVKAYQQYLAAVGEGMEKKLRVVQYETLQDLVLPEVARALKNFLEHTARLKRDLSRRKADAETAFEGYQAAGPKLEGAVAEYATLLREEEAIKADIRRLDPDALLDL